MNLENIVPGMWLTYALLQHHCVQHVPCLVVMLYPEKIGIAIPYGPEPKWHPLTVTTRYLSPLRIR